MKEIASVLDKAMQNSGPCHATVKKRSGMWSFHRIGFCGCEPSRGPTPMCDKPDGGLCRVCSGYIEKVDGVWRVKKRPVYCEVLRHGPPREFVDDD